jgi:hypothetical protein
LLRRRYDGDHLIELQPPQKSQPLIINQLNLSSPP